MDYSKFEKIETFIFDVDGVLTDGTLHITEEGEFLRRMFVRDGSAMKMAIRAGYRIAVITKGNSKGVEDRLKFLGANPYFGSVDDKSIALKECKETHNIDLGTVLYMGDDLADLVVFDKVLLACCPNDASDDVLKKAEYISHKGGGKGCVRDVIERVLRAQDKWPNT